MREYSVTMDHGIGVHRSMPTHDIHRALDMWRGSLEAERTLGATLEHVSRQAPMLHALLTRDGHTITVVLNLDIAQVPYRRPVSNPNRRAPAQCR